MTRASEGFAKEGQRLAQGRPLGLMLSWLSVAGLCETKAEHESFQAFLPNEERSTHRKELASLANGQDLAANERPLRTGEPAEPLGLA